MRNKEEQQHIKIKLKTQGWLDMGRTSAAASAITLSFQSEVSEALSKV